MYQERLAKLTADHLRIHIKDYLAEIDSFYTGKDKVTLVVPKSVEVASEVGGLMTEFDSILPQYAVDCKDKIFLGQVTENLFTYQYAGAITALVSGTSQDSTDKLIKRHYAAIELFIKRHLLMHEEKNDDFSVIELNFIESNFSGAENVVDTDNDREAWLGACTVVVSWVTSENGPEQHA